MVYRFPSKKTILWSLATKMTALFTIAKMYKYPKRASVNEWINKVWHMHAMEHYSAIKKKPSTDTCYDMMHLENIL